MIIHRPGLIQRQNMLRGANGVVPKLNARRAPLIQCSAIRSVYSGIPVQLTKFKAGVTVKVQRPRRAALKTLALFEKFTERSIKSIMLGQQAAKVRFIALHVSLNSPS